jgi:hypothetical protein
LTDFPLGKLRSKITLLSGESLFVTVLSGDILSWIVFKLECNTKEQIRNCFMEIKKYSF